MNILHQCRLTLENMVDAALHKDQGQRTKMHNNREACRSLQIQKKEKLYEDRASVFPAPMGVLIRAGQVPDRRDGWILERAMF